MAKKEFKIGEVFQCGLVKLKVEKSGIGECKDCFFGCSLFNCELIAIFTGPCAIHEREDKESVIFKKVEE